MLFSVPAKLNGQELVEELKAAGVPVDITDVRVEDEQLVIDTSAARSKVEKIVAAHVATDPAAVDPLTDDEITRLRALLLNAR